MINILLTNSAIKKKVVAKVAVFLKYFFVYCYIILLQTFLSLGIVIILWFYFALWIQSSGKLAHVNDAPGQEAESFYYYKKDIAMKVNLFD